MKINRLFNYPVGVPGEGLLTSRKKRAPVCPTCRKRQLKGATESYQRL